MRSRKLRVKLTKKKTFVIFKIEKFSKKKNLLVMVVD